MSRTRVSLAGGVALALVVGLGGGLAEAPASAERPLSDAVAAGPDYSRVVATLKQEIPQIMKDGGVVGSTVALIDGNKVIMQRGFGWADRARQRAVTNKTLFHIGSLSKLFSATAVMQLVEAGKVDLDAPLSRYVPEFRLQPRFKNNVITVRSVLDHHSGIPGDVFNGMITVRKPVPTFRSWLVKALSHMKPERRVNTEWAYNNSGSVLLQNLVENVTGQPFASYTKRVLFSRMGMNSSTYDDTAPPGKKLTRNYSPKVDADKQPIGGTKVEPREFVNGWTAGSILSSSRDMTNFLRMAVSQGKGVNARVIKKNTLREMTTPQTDLAIDLQVHGGLGWFIEPADSSWMGKVIEHDGATGLNFSDLLVLPKTRLAVFVSTNTVGGSPVAAAVAKRALGLAFTAKTGIPEPPSATLPTLKPRTPSKAELKAAAGRYAITNGYDTVKVQGKQLLWTVGDSGKRAAFSASTGKWWWSAEHPDVQIRFRSFRGRHMMILRIPAGPTISVQGNGELVPKAKVGKKWHSVLGTYRAVNANPYNDPGLVATEITLSVKDGLVLMGLGGPGGQVLSPLKKGKSFTFGYGTSKGRNKGDIVTVGGGGLTYMGVKYRKL